MKFRGMINDPAALREFMHIGVGLSKLSKDCIMRITATKVYFIVSDDEGGPKHPYIWAELPVGFYFREFAMAGATEEFNEIYLEFNTLLLAKSLSALKQNTKSLKIKLTNKETPCLTLDIEQISNHVILSRQIVHDIPAEVIPRKHWTEYKEPVFTDFHVSLHLPSLKSIKNILERMKNVTNTLVVSTNKAGRLTLRAKTNMVTLSAHFNDLNVESFAVGHGLTLMDETQDEQIYSQIDAKKFLQFLSAMHINNCKTVCSIIQSRMVKLHLEQPGALSLQCFLMQVDL